MPPTEWVHDLKVVELKEECKKRGLPVGGKKAELVERLEAWIAENEKSPEGAAAAEEPAGQEKDEEQAAEAEEEEEQAEEAAADEDKAEAAAEGTEEQPAAAAAATEEQPAAAAEEPAAEQQEPAAAPEEAAPAPMEAEGAAEPAAEAPAAGEAEAAQQPSPAAADKASEEEAAPAEQQQAAAMEEDRAAAAAQEPAQPAAAADVDLDYGEDSDAEGGAAAAQQPAEQQRGKQAEEAPKRKREEEQAAAAPRRVSGSRGPSADKAIAAAASQGSAERPSKVPRSGSGFSLSNAEKGEAPAPEDVPEAEEPATRALRIDGFVRPFTERQVRELLSETGQVLALWMPSIKTHAYCVFETKAQAEATRRATYQLQWPATNPKRLAPRFVPLTEAETAIGTGAGNPDFRLKRTEEDGEAEAAAAAPAAAAKAASEGSKEEAAPAVDRSKREWNRNRRSPSPPLEGVRDLREMLSRKASGGRSSDAPAAAAAAAAAGPSRGGSEREGAALPPGLGRTAERRSDPEPERRGSRGREEHPVRTLDELFRKTTAKPCIYWLPLTDEQVAEKKRKAAAAAEQAKPPAANGSAEKK